MNRWWLVAFAPALVFLALGPPAGAAEKKGAKEAATEPGDAGKKPFLTEPLVIEMEEVQAFGKGEMGGGPRLRFPSGQFARCSTTPNKEVKAYPALKSKQPLYGSVTFDSNFFDPKAGTTYYFVLDESGEAEKKADADGGKTEAKKPAKTKKKAGEAKEKKSSLLNALAKSAEKTVPAVTEEAFGRPRSQGTYDRLYFDLNRDRDLTNDGVIKASEKPPFEGMPVFSAGRWFEELKVSFDFGAPLGKRPCVLVPQAIVFGQGSGYVSFVSKTMRKGKARLGDRDCVVCLSHSQIISGRYDRPMVQLEVYPADRAAKPALVLKSGPLGQMQVVDGQLLTASASPLGDRLTIAPYRGDFGVLEIGPGGRAITEMGLAGMLMGRAAIVPLGDVNRPPEALPRRYKVPVGDYILPTLTAQYGRLRFNARTISSADAASGPSFAGSRLVQIRKDKPYVLEFSGKAEVKFMAPLKTKTFQPGDRVDIRAMLDEPWQGMQITGLFDTTKKTGTAKYQLEGRNVSVPRFKQLDPTIVIRNAAGKEISSGKMPFG